MALIKCPECRKEISDTALKCPNCGMNIKKAERNAIGKIFLYIYFMDLMFLCFGG